jgi:UDP-glucuronate 4-epimerase
MKNILVTGSAGFIGFHLTKALLVAGFKVVGIDNINNYYDQQLKHTRLDNLENFVGQNSLVQNYNFIKMDICDESSLTQLFADNNFDIVINLAAQAGVRYSIENPGAYIKSNLVGFSNILECCRHFDIKHLLFASSSSVYGMNKKQPFSEDDVTDSPVSLYAATKKSNELLAHSYSHLYGIPATGLRFFTVYGPYGRPDMAYYKFTKAIDSGKSIDVYNNGHMKRDFTYIDDIIQGIMKLIVNSSIKDITNDNEPYMAFQIFNIGNNKPISLRKFISSIESALGKKAIENLKPMQDGDVVSTYADINKIKNYCGFVPLTSIEKGMKNFVEWYKEYINTKKT